MPARRTFTSSEKEEIITLRALGITATRIAEYYGVSSPTIGKLLYGIKPLPIDQVLPLVRKRK